MNYKDQHYLFRGKRKDNGQWAEGFVAENGFPFLIIALLFKNWSPKNIKWYISTPKVKNWDSPRQFEIFEVEKKSINRFTKKTDKHGKKIFVGDCFLGKNKIGTVIIDHMKMKIAWYGHPRKTLANVYNKSTNNYEFLKSVELDTFNTNNIEVICNSYDHPEVLSGNFESIKNLK